MTHPKPEHFIAEELPDIIKNITYALQESDPEHALAADNFLSYCRAIVANVIELRTPERRGSRARHRELRGKLESNVYCLAAIVGKICRDPQETANIMFKIKGSLGLKEQGFDIDSVDQKPLEERPETATLRLLDQTKKALREWSWAKKE